MTTQEQAPETMTSEQQAAFEAVSAKVAEVRQKVVDVMIENKVDIGVGVFACFDIAMSMIGSDLTPPGARAAFATVLMDAAHGLSARVSEEQADGVMTADQESARPQIITEV